jgi:hypothetical protein
MMVVVIEREHMICEQPILLNARVENISAAVEMVLVDADEGSSGG